MCEIYVDESVPYTRLLRFTPRNRASPNAMPRAIERLALVANDVLELLREPTQRNTLLVFSPELPPASDVEDSALLWQGQDAKFKLGAIPEGEIWCNGERRIEFPTEDENDLEFFAYQQHFSSTSCRYLFTGNEDNDLLQAQRFLVDACVFLNASDVFQGLGFVERCNKPMLATKQVFQEVDEGSSVF